ncbi:MAG: site-specific DNA-methyltransferase (adenine-specific) [Arenicella sp.]|jgi:site-specific DNA-methyltransferase (adenine-specific)
MSIELLHADCMDYMRDQPDNAFELAIVDPPYGIGESGKTNNTRSKLATAKNYKSFHGDDLVAPSEEYFRHIRRVSKNQIIWGANHFIDNFSLSASSPCWVVWDKDNGKNDFADCELAWCSFKTAVRMFKYTWHGMRQGDMKNKEQRIHPTQKPVKLYDWLLANYAKEGDRILDTHLGSGSSAIAAHYGGFDFVGMELDADYYKAACERFDRETRQADMF